MMTLQEIYTKVAKHLLSQKAQSCDDGVCMYRGNEGLSCAIGCLIKDEFYTPKMEKTTVIHQNWEDTASTGVSISLNNALYKSIGKFPPLGASLLISLRTIHDRVPIEEWEEVLVKCADEYKLEATAQ